MTQCVTASETGAQYAQIQFTDIQGVADIGGLITVAAADIDYIDVVTLSVSTTGLSMDWVDMGVGAGPSRFFYGIITDVTASNPLVRVTDTTGGGKVAMVGTYFPKTNAVLEVVDALAAIQIWGGTTPDVDATNLTIDAFAKNGSTGYLQLVVLASTYFTTDRGGQSLDVATSTPSDPTGGNIAQRGWKDIVSGDSISVQENDDGPYLLGTTYNVDLTNTLYRFAGGSFGAGIDWGSDTTWLVFADYTPATASKQLKWTPHRVHVTELPYQIHSGMVK